MNQRGHYWCGGKGPWSGFSAFQVFSDHLAMSGFYLLVRLLLDPRDLGRAIFEGAKRRRAGDGEVSLDVARAAVRAGVGLIEQGPCEFVFASTEEAIIIIRPAAAREIGDSFAIHDMLVSRYAGRFALLSGAPVAVLGEVYEFPDLGVAAKSIVAAQQHLERTAIERALRRLAEDRAALGESLAVGALTNDEDRRLCLRNHGVDVDALPAWWRRGLAARMVGGGVELLEPAPAGGDLSAAISKAS